DNAGWVFGAVLGVAVWIIAAFFAAVAAGIIAYAKIVLTLMVVFAPIAIVCSLFKPTQTLFDAWSRSIIGYAFMPIAAAGAAGIVIAVAGQVAGSSPDPNNVDTLSLIFPFIVVLVLSAGIMLAVPSIAMGLSGAIGIASNAVGLSGLVKSGAAGGGAAVMRGATGASPQAARQAMNTGLEAVGKRVSAPVKATPAKLMAATKALRGK
ncbi:type IV secretion system protein, partial [Pseudorhodobacter sp.]|uniref:type IV secretion system protein n=1 Tax=Pseudorhodobacter sp. TaxID=1934400 RepID=UPI00264880A0